jgi:RND family efflux transporter MFP subunit
MARPIKIILPVFILIAASGVAWQLLANSPKAKREAIRPEAPLVQTLQVQPRDVRVPVFTQGTVKPRTSITLSTEVSGRIVATAPQFADGGFFKKDDVLLRVDPNDYQLAITKADALVAGAKQQLAQAEAEYKQKQQEYHGVDRSKITDYALRKPQYEEAAARLKAAKADLELARLQLQRCEIRAPFDGRVIEKKADIGQYVTTGSVVANIYAVDIAEVRLPLSQTQADLLDLPLILNASQPAAPIAVKLSGQYAGQNHTWEGEIVRTEASVDERNRLLYVVAQVQDPYSMHATRDPQDSPQSDPPPLAMGMFVQGEIQSRVLKDIYPLPRNAVHNMDTVWLLDDNTRLKIQAVRVVHRDAQHVYVAQGLKPGDTVIISPLDVAVGGMQLRLASSESKEAR